MPVLDLLPLKKKKKAAPKGFTAPVINVPRYTPELVPSPSALPRCLSQKLSALGDRFRMVKVSERVAQAVGAAVILLTLQMFLDWLLDLNLLARALLLAADIWLVVTFVRKYLRPLITRPPNEEKCALMVEKQWPRLRGQVIAAVQLSKPGFSLNSPLLVKAVQHGADSKTASMNFNEIVPLRLVQRQAGIAGLALVVWLGLMVFLAPGSLALLERVFLLPAKVPRKTDVICLSGNKTIAAGDNVVLEAQASGIIPSHGRVTLVDDTGHIQEITIDREPGQPDRFSLMVDRLEHPLTYTIVLNDGTSGAYQIKTVPRPNVTSIDCQQVYPAYTGLDSIKRTVGNLALLAGSQLKIHATANSKIVKASINLIGINKVLPLTINGPGLDDLTGQIDIPADGLTGFSIELTNEAGITSGDDTEYRIDLIPDRPPSIQVTYPERLQELYTLKAKPAIAFVASDDYGLAKITLCYRIVPDEDADANATPPEPTRIEMSIGSGHPLNLKNWYPWDLSAVTPPLTEGTTIEYWVEAQDDNNITGPGIGSSEHHTIRVVSEVEKRAEVMNRLLDNFSVLNELQQDQEKINQDLGDALEGKMDKK